MLFNTNVTSVLLVLLTLMLSGCSFFKGDDDDDEDIRQPAELVRFDEEVNIERLWSVAIGRGAEDKAIQLVPAYAGSRVFAASADGSVKALNSANGKVIWQINIEDFYSAEERKVAFNDSADSITGGVGLGEELVLVGSSAGDIVAMNQSDGSLAWRADTTSEVLAPPQAKNNIVVAQSIDGKIAAFDPLDGSRLWLYATSVPSLTLRGTSTPIVTDYVLAGFANGRIAVIDIQQGLAVMDQRIAASLGKSDLERLVDIDGLMVQEGGNLFVVSYQGNLVAIDLAKNGQLLWAREASSTVGLGSGFGNVYLATADSELIAIDMDTSRDSWDTKALLYRDITSPVATGSYVVVGDFDGYLHVLAQSDGRFVGRQMVDKKGLTSPAVIDGSRIYIYGDSGRLSALEIR
ncbi:MAG: outer membrane protein assembly factor BamB [Pseudomonadales bacterium]|nr:outer membrane protein assembly factor BamB [Pseudomonadales bacterium]